MGAKAILFEDNLGVSGHDGPTHIVPWQHGLICRSPQMNIYAQVLQGQAGIWVSEIICILYIYILCDTACVYPHLSLWAFSCSLLRLVRADTEEDRQALSRPWVSAMGLAVSPATRPWSKRGRCQRQLPAKKNHMSSRWSEAHRAQQCGNDVARIIKGRSWECHVVLYCTEPCCVAIHFAPWNAKECAPQRPQHAAAASHFAESCDTMQIDAGLGSWEKPLKLRGCTRLAAQKFRPKLPSEWSERSVFASGLDAWNSIRCLRSRNHHGGWCQGMGCGQRPSDCTTRLSQQTGEAKLSMAVANSAGGAPLAMRCLGW